MKDLSDQQVVTQAVSIFSMDQARTVAFLGRLKTTCALSLSRDSNVVVKFDGTILKARVCFGLIWLLSTESGAQNPVTYVTPTWVGLVIHFHAASKRSARKTLVHPSIRCGRQWWLSLWLKQTTNETQSCYSAFGIDHWSICLLWDRRHCGVD